MKLIFCILGLAAMALAEDELTLINDKFTAQMTYEVAKLNKGKNVVLSAFSVLPPLAQLSLASVGESHDELLRALNLPNDNATKSAFSNVQQQLRTIKGVELNLANRVYVANDAKLNTQFATLSKDIFNSEVKNIDFKQSASAAKEINEWVEDKTNNKIKDLLSPDAVTSATRAVLVNAIYFKGKWDKQFNKEKTAPKDFYLSNGETSKVPMMVVSDDFRYGESAALDAKLLEMRYVGGEASFLIVLPNKKDGISNLQEKLKDPSLLEKAVADMTISKVDVALPKFKIETSTNLKDVLQKLNINKLFTTEARLDYLLENESNLYISDAIQKAFIEVNEEGAEAAAANALPMKLSPLILLETKFVVDRPFYFEIKAGEITLFNGVVQEPKV